MKSPFKKETEESNNDNMLFVNIIYYISLIFGVLTSVMMSGKLIRTELWILTFVMPVAVALILFNNREKIKNIIFNTITFKKTKKHEKND